jgi:hypothetical protein
MKFRFLLTLPAILLIACAHHRDVRPSADGINYVVVRDPTREAAERSALRQANHYCESLEKHAAIVSEKSDYKGSMDENTRETLRKASAAAMILGGGAGVLGHEPGVRSGGSVVGAAGTVGAVMTSGDDYVAEMKFKCQ